MASIRRHLFEPAPALLAVAAIAGCGSSDGSGPLSAEELVSRGDEICVEEQRRYAEVQAHAPASASEGAEQTAELIEISTEQLDELRGLEPPEELKRRFDSYLAARDRAIELLRKGLAAAERRDQRAYGAAQERSKHEGERRRKLALAVGFRDCSRPAVKAR